MRTLVLGLIAATVTAAPATAQADFEWRGRLAAGKTIEIRGINGDVVAGPATGDEVRVTAIKREHRRGRAEDVRIEVVEHGDGVTICAIYPGRRGRRNECEPGGGHQENENNDVSVEFSVRVPAGVRLVAGTVNGDVRGRGLRSDADLSSVNGSVDVATTGYAEASTVNGSVDVAMGSTTWPGHLDFVTVNGEITLELPAGVKADVEASTINGDISTDFPLTVDRVGRSRVRGTIGGGGAGLSLTTVNGSIRLRKGA